MSSDADPESTMSIQERNWSFIVNLGNSIIGVSVLAMPFCFKQCGIVLGPLLLLCCAWLTQVSCRLLMKAATASKRRSYEFLAYHTFGAMGKLAVEISIIGLLVGSCIAFHVIIGDLGPAIISKLFGVENNSTLRTTLMVFLGMFVAFPLGLLRNIDSLSGLCKISMGFYAVFVIKMFTVAGPNLWSGIWYNNVQFWNPGAIFQVLPIFSLAFACQTQLFVIYDALPDPSLHSMNKVMSGAVTLCGTVYLLVGFFGYVAFYEGGPPGDVLLSFKPFFFNELIKMAFVLSVAISFPLVVFPCRASLNSLLFSHAAGASHGNIGGHSIIPPLRFKVITLVIVGGTLIIGILIPDVEFILGLTGATMGTMICFIFPAVMYIQVVGKSGNTGHIYARVVLVLGVVILVASTYTTLMTHDKAVSEQSIVINKPVVSSDEVKGGDPRPVEEIINNVEQGADSVKNKVLDEKGFDSKAKVEESLQKPQLSDTKGKDVGDGVKIEEKRQEPPNPQEPPEDGASDKKEGGEEKVEKSKREAVDTPQKAPVSPAVVNPSPKPPAVEANKDEVKQLIKELRDAKDEQKKILEEQKEIVAELKVHQKEAHPDQAAVKEQKIIQEKHEEIQKDLSKLLEKMQGIKKISDDKQPVAGVTQGINQPGNIPNENVAVNQGNANAQQGVNANQLPQGNVVNSQQRNVANGLQGNAGNVPIGNAGNAPIGNAGNVPIGNAGNAPIGNAGNVPIGNAGNAPLRSARDVPQGNEPNVGQQNVQLPNAQQAANGLPENDVNMLQGNAAQQGNVANVPQGNAGQQNIDSAQQVQQRGGVQQNNIPEQAVVNNVPQAGQQPVQQQQNNLNQQHENVKEQKAGKVQQDNVQQPVIANAGQQIVNNNQQQQQQVVNNNQQQQQVVHNNQQQLVGDDLPQQNLNLQKKDFDLDTILKNQRVGDTKLVADKNLVPQNSEKKPDVHQET